MDIEVQGEYASAVIHAVDASDVLRPPYNFKNRS